MCYMDPNCVSINIGPLDEGKHKCELNNVTEENHAPFLLVNKPGYTYLAIEVTFIFFLPEGSVTNPAIRLVTSAFDSAVRIFLSLLTGTVTLS